MSAFVVSKKHIDYLVTAALAWRLFPPEDADTVGQMLWVENAKSVAHRYSEALEAIAYKHARSKPPLSVVQVLKAVQCLEYQSCEHPGWDDGHNGARKMLERLRSEAISRLPGYEAAQWAISDDVDAL